MKTHVRTVNVVSLGCSKNLVDSEYLLRQLEAGGFSVEHDSNNFSDIVIINTCGFINDAKQESIDAILGFAEARKKGKIKELIVMGCLSQRYKDTLKKEIPEVSQFFGLNENSRLLAYIGVNYKKELLGERKITTPSHYAYLKIAEGCNHKCAFCAIPMIRGKLVSKPIEKITAEAKWLASKGVKELLLIAQDTTAFGIDIYGKRELSTLLRKLAGIQGIEWIRLHYTYPAGFPEDVLDVIAEEKKICKYIDVPLQHISDRILSSMKRGIDSQQTIRLLEKMRDKVPGIAIRTTLITGYPGESQAEFEMLKEFIVQQRFDRLGIFTYSHEEDTPAFTLTDNIPESEKQQRLEVLMKIQQEISLENNRRKLGKTLKAMIDRKEGDYYIARSEYDSPEVDNEILIPAKNCHLDIGHFYDVNVYEYGDYEIYAHVNM